MIRRLLTVSLMVTVCRVALACSCQLQHPQTHFCNSDFVIVGRVQKLFKGNMFYDSYKVKIRNTFKATPKAIIALKSGRVLTPSQDSLCGITLKPRETYIITGTIIHLEAHMGMCGYINKWRDVTARQRKGFRSLYKRGCTCKVRISNRRRKSANTCVADYDECYERHGICLHDKRKQCRWTRAPALKRCLQALGSNATMT